MPFMKQSFSSDKMNLAWFKLEEFVARGEKERALNIYRLLMHSVHDEAVKAQLEGDILRAFNDVEAVNSYLRAAAIYEKEEKLIQAVDLYELINVMMPDSYEHGKAMLELYQQLSHIIKLCAAAKHLLTILIKRDQFVQAHELVQEIRLEDVQKADLHAQLIIGMLNSDKKEDKALKQAHLQAALDGYLESEGHDSVLLNQFLTTLAALDDQTHAQACQMLSNTVKMDCTKESERK